MASKPLFSIPESSNIKAAKVLLFPGEDVGSHITESSEEVIIVMKGTATLLLEGRTEPVKVQEGGAYYIGEDTRHNVRNDTDAELEYIYVVCNK